MRRIVLALARAAYGHIGPEGPTRSAHPRQSMGRFHARTVSRSNGAGGTIATR